MNYPCLKIGASEITFVIVALVPSALIFLVVLINIAARAAVNQFIVAKANALSNKPTTLVVGY